MKLTHCSLMHSRDDEAEWLSRLKGHHYTAGKQKELITNDKKLLPIFWFLNTYVSLFQFMES